MKIKLSHTEVEHKLFLEVLGVYVILALVLVGAYYVEPVITGFVTVTKQSDYVLILTNQKLMYGLWEILEI